jgi:hypothetical protein
VCWIVFRTRLIPKRYVERGRSYIRRKVWLMSQSIPWVPIPPPPGRLSGIFNCTCSQGRAFAFYWLAPGWGICSAVKSRIFVACISRILIRNAFTFTRPCVLRINPHIMDMADIHTLDFFLVHTVDTLTLFSQFDIVISSLRLQYFN